MDGDEQGEGREGEEKRRSTRKGSDLLQIPGDNLIACVLHVHVGLCPDQHAPGVAAATTTSMISWFWLSFPASASNRGFCHNLLLVPPLYITTRGNCRHHCRRGHLLDLVANGTTPEQDPG